MSRTIHTAGARTAAIITALLLSLSACGGGTPAGSGGEQVDQADLTRAEEAVARASEGTDGEVPSQGPAGQTDKSIWVITCGQAAAGCATPGDAAVEAARALGWKATLCDGKLSQPTYAECVNSAAAARPDAIILVAVDCQFVKAPLESAKSAGAKIYGINNFDCDQSGGQGGGQKHFDAKLQYHGFEDHKAFMEKGLGPAQANYIIAKTGGEARTLVVRQDDTLSSVAIADGAEATLEGCSGCKTYTVDTTLDDVVTGKLATKVSAALTRYPDVNAVTVPYDAQVLLGVGQAVSGAGRPLILAGVEGLEANIDLIKQGQQTMAGGLSPGWSGWAAVDGVNRLLAGAPQVDSGIGYQIVDESENLPTTTGYYDGNVSKDGAPLQDYKAIYLKSWGR